MALAFAVKTSVRYLLVEFPLESHRLDPLATYESNLTLLGSRTSTAP
jgi:hypothetical protein